MKINYCNFRLWDMRLQKLKISPNPKVAILNIGTEEGKGKEYLQGCL